MPAKARAATVRKPKASATTTRRAKATATKAKRVEVTVEDLADFNESINGLVYGDSGVGKTPFVGGAPDAVFIGTEKGSISAKRFGSKAKLIRATSWDKLEAAVDYLEANPDKFRWAIVDSVTKMQQLLLRHLLERNVADGGKNADIDIPQIQDHQKWQNMFKRFIDRLIDLDVNVVFVATAMHKEDAEGDDLVLPDLQGKDYQISQYVCAQMDFVYCLKTATNKKTDEPEWWLITKSRPPFFAKDRYNAVPAIVRQPDFAEVIEAIENSAAAAEPNANVQKRRARKGLVIDDTDPGEIDDDEEELDDEELNDDDDIEEDDDDDIESDDDIEEDDDDDEDDDEEDEEPPVKAAPKTARRKPVATTRRAKPAARKPEPEEDDDEDDDEEEAAPPARRRTPRKSTAKKPAARPVASRRRTGKAEPDPDEFDPEDDDDDDDFDDDED